MVAVEPGRDAASSTRRVQRATSDALVAICRTRFPDARVATSAVNPDDLVRAARHHRIAPLAHVVTRDSDPELAAPLRPDRDRAIAVHLAATAALDNLATILDDLPWLTFKGPVLSEHAHPAAGLRTYQDIDVLVDPLNLREVTRRLGDAGWVAADYEDMLRNPELPGEMHWNSPAGLQVDLHWAMINMSTRRRRFTMDSRSLISRRRRMPVALTEVWTLDPVDTLVHVCLHAALSGANRMLFLLDVDQVARGITDWDEVAARAREWNATAHVILVLDRAARVLGTPLPNNVGMLLGVSPAFRRASALANRFSPVDRKSVV